MFKWLTNLRNKRSAEKHGWSPLWFGASSFDERLIEKIKNSKISGACTRMDIAARKPIS